MTDAGWDDLVRRLAESAAVMAAIQLGDFERMQAALETRSGLVRRLHAELKGPLSSRRTETLRQLWGAGEDVLLRWRTWRDGLAAEYAGLEQDSSVLESIGRTGSGPAFLDING